METVYTSLMESSPTIAVLLIWMYYERRDRKEERIAQKEEIVYFRSRLATFESLLIGYYEKTKN